MPRFRQPVFVGKDVEDGEYFVLYVERVGAMEDLQFHFSARNTLPPQDHYFIKFPDGEVWALPPEAEIWTWEDESDSYVTHLRIKSSVWTGEAIGTREELLREEGYSV